MCAVHVTVSYVRFVRAVVVFRCEKSLLPLIGSSDDPCDFVIIQAAGM